MTETHPLEYLQSPSIAKLMPALLAAVQEFDPVLKDATNPHFKSRYSSLSNVLKAVTPALLAHDLLPTQQTSCNPAGGQNMVLTRVIHVSGEWIGARWLLNPAKADPQGEGSALTYARRYTLCALLNIAAEDDDAAAASVNRPARPAAAAAPPKAEPSHREWLAEAAALASKTRIAAVKRREQLLALMEECRGFGELTAEMYGQFVEMGRELARDAEIAAA